MSHRRKPSEIRFSQDSIKSHWWKFPGQIGETLDQLLTGEVKVDEIPKIEVEEIEGNLYSADNRRLWVFQKLEKLGKCDTIAVKFGNIESRKLTTKNSGTSVRIRRPEDPGGKIWKILEKEIVSSTFTAAIDNRSCLEARQSPRANKWTDTTLSSAFENTIQIEEMEKNFCLSDIGYYQTNPLSDGEYLGELLDKWLQIDFSKYFLELQVFKRFGRYYTKQCTKLWVLKNFEKFNKRPEIKFIMTDPPFAEMNDSICSHSLSNSLKTSAIGGSVWKNVDYLKTLTTLETVKSVVSEIYFTMATISDTYENESLAKVLADSYAAWKLPRLIRVVKFGGKYYALDNELLWVVKEIQSVKEGFLRVSVEVKIEMDQPLFKGFISENIQEVTIQETNFSHTNEESFILKCMKRISKT